MDVGRSNGVLTDSAALENGTADFRDKNFLFSDAQSGSKDAWVVRGFQLSKLFVYQCLSALLAVLCVLFVILLISVSVRQGGGGYDNGGSQSAALRGVECEEPSCIQQAAQMVGYMNFSANPCQDFYEYACGNFDVMHPRGIHISYGVSNMLADYNRGRLEELLEQPQFHDDDSAISKARTFYTSCVTAYDHATNYAQDMVKLINTFGGMEIFDSWNSTGWRFHDVFRQTREIHRVRLFFVVIWFQKLDRIIIRLPRLGLSSRTSYKTSNPLYNTTMLRYRQTITSVMSMLEQDSQVLLNSTSRPCNDSCVKEIVDDIISIETSISNLAPSIIDILPTPTNNVNLTELGKLTDEIDWRELMDSLFGKGSITDTASIHIPSREYMTGINNLIKETPKKKMHHYIMWATIKQYLKALGPKYSLLEQELAKSVDEQESKPRPELCFELLSTYMGRAVRAMFISEHIGDHHVDKIKEFVAEARKVLDSSFTWMSESSRSMSQEVLRNITALYGHSSWITNKERLNDYYKEMSLESMNFFKNLKSAYEFQSIEYKTKAAVADEDSDAESGYWIKSDPVDVRVTYSPLLLAMNIPYGALQVPWYNHNNPSYLNAAAIGSIVYSVLAQPFLLHHRTFKTPDWWDSDTTNRYNEYKSCIRDSFSRYVTRIPRGFQMSQGAKKLMFMRPEVKLDPRPSLDYLQAEHFAFNLAFKLHKSLEKKQDKVVLLPGMKHSTSDQTFFLSYAQSRCQNNQPYLEVLLNAAFHKFPHPKMINNFAFNNEHFRDAFHCDSVPEEHTSRQCQL